ncbi:MAG: exodeoxyribonuclease VII small subunit [Oligoflexus sp.]|jgi:exodeoxyribonuclease VII small subunit
MQESLTYQAMLTEVETIVRDIASPELDLDLMVGKVERAYELLRTMKLRLEDTKLRIDQLQQRFEDK